MFGQSKSISHATSETLATMPPNQIEPCSTRGSMRKYFFSSSLFTSNTIPAYIRTWIHPERSSSLRTSYCWCLNSLNPVKPDEETRISFWNQQHRIVSVFIHSTSLQICHEPENTQDKINTAPSDSQHFIPTVLFSYTVQCFSII